MRSDWFKYRIKSEAIETTPNPQTVENYNEKWPSEGKIEFQNYWVKYRANLPFVLKNITFTINPNEKVGVVGRTGSGKSTTLLSILRILEASEGKILIDGVDVSKLGLFDLRNKITIIPQVLFNSFLIHFEHLGSNFIQGNYKREYGFACRIQRWGYMEFIRVSLHERKVYERASFRYRNQERWW